VEGAQGEVEVEADGDEGLVGAEGDEAAGGEDAAVDGGLGVEGGEFVGRGRGARAGADAGDVPGGHEGGDALVVGEGGVGAEEGERGERGGDEVEGGPGGGVDLGEVLVRAAAGGGGVAVLQALGGLEMGGQVLAELDAGGAQVAATAYAEAGVGEVGDLSHEPAGGADVGLDEVPGKPLGPVEGAEQSLAGAVGAAHAVGDAGAVEEFAGGQQARSCEVAGGGGLADAGLLVGEAAEGDGGGDAVGELERGLTAAVHVLVRVGVGVPQARDDGPVGGVDAAGGGAVGAVRFDGGDAA
jgi:hypothetical protein